jgi:aspartate ammonia-lyase
MVTHSIGLVTALNPVIGYQNATRIAQTAQATGRGVADLVLEEGLLSPVELADILRPENMTQPRRIAPLPSN